MFTAIKNFFSRLAFWRKKPVSRKWKRSEPKPRAVNAGALRMQNQNGRVSVAPTGNGDRPLTARNARRLAKKQERKHGNR